MHSIRNASVLALMIASCGFAPDAVAVKVQRDPTPATQAQPQPAQSPSSQAAAAPSVTSAAPELPKLTAVQIADRNAQARGGLTAWRAIHSIQMSGVLDAGGRTNVQLPFMLKMKRPHYQRVEIEFQGQTAVQVYDGQNGWKLRPFLNRNDVEPLSDEEQQRLAHQDDLDGPLIDYAAKGSTLELDGTEIVEDKPNYRLKLTMKDGTTRRIWIDASTFLESKMEGNPRRLDGRMRKVENYLRDYRKVDNVLIPFVSETRVETAPKPRKITLDKVVLNPQFEDRVFGEPVAPVGKAAGQPVRNPATANTTTLPREAGSASQ